VIAPSFSFRRRLLLASAVGLAASAARRSPAQATTGKPIKAVAFDGFVAMHAEELFPGRGAALMDSWRSGQFESTWAAHPGRPLRRLPASHARRCRGALAAQHSIVLG
jgi:hypothetical protein